MFSFGNLLTLACKLSWRGWLVFIESQKKEIPQHKLQIDRITQKWVILCSGTKGVN